LAADLPPCLIGWTDPRAPSYQACLPRTYLLMACIAKLPLRHHNNPCVMYVCSTSQTCHSTAPSSAPRCSPSIPDLPSLCHLPECHIMMFHCPSNQPCKCTFAINTVLCFVLTLGDKGRLHRPPWPLVAAPLRLSIVVSPTQCGNLRTNSHMTIHR
jgi:hypothetical protein